MSNFIVSKYKLFQWLFLFPTSLLVCYFVTMRDENLRDYQNYLFMFNNLAEDVEPSFRLINKLFFSYTDGFLYLLFVYAFLGFFLKIYFGSKFIHKQQGLYLYILYLISYLIVFFTLWDLIQIRYSVGVSFFILGAFYKNYYVKLIFFVLAVLFHYSMILPIGLYLILFFVEKNIYRLALIPLLLVVSSFAMKQSLYAEKYTKSAYNIESVPLLSGQYFFIFLMFILFCFLRRMVNPIFKKEVNIIFLISTSMLFLMVVMAAYFPAISDRLLSMTTFLFLLCLFFIKGKYYKFVLTVFIIIFNLWYLKTYILNPYGLLYNPY
ncbi:EpsG family protein [Acinetobacter pittii]|uniref:Oligosaccharide-unit polymerase n=3 Tax=Acinetobacter calcoaceticus/baumannii complex TaxID=909768 RepID=A0A8F2ZGH7_ACIBA|nr:EpsG family protein [Acinetobacter pittii]OCY73478.1 hypothetical protein BFR86_06640 [Acinetobacter pittii]OCY79085.1 hypothetical protein BFR88_08350 [Acinetobacter pittii]QWY12748.1 oligosaccharide-unit polymerase [Acinetobacter baumannii]